MFNYSLGSYLQILVLITIGIILLWFGFSLFISGQLALVRLGWIGRSRRRRRRKSGHPGDPQVCPVCSAILNKGELVSSHAYPSLSGGRDRLMHIRGCCYCLEADRPRPRHCPVCRNPLRENDYLISRMFERPLRRNHVHVIGCNRCKRG